MLIRFKTGWLRTSSAMHQWLLVEAVRQLNSPLQEKMDQELPDRGRSNETKTVTDPHGKPVQE